MAAVINETGNRYGLLTVIRRDGTLGLEAAWLCQCDCGKTKTIRGRSLRIGDTKSCGHLAYGNHRLAFGESSKRGLLHSYKQCAKKRNHKWGLGEKKFYELTKQDCFYCGLPPSQMYQPGKQSYGKYIYSGIDRVNSQIGYTTRNVVACCRRCNCAKNNMSVTEFKEWVRRVYARSVVVAGSGK